MRSPALTTYLEDHLAGSTLALEMLATLRERSPDPACAALAESLHTEITLDRSVLETIARDAAPREADSRRG